MNRISGRVLIEETNAGINDVIVAAFHVPDEKVVKLSKASHNLEVYAELNGLGSCFAKKGVFEMTYETGQNYGKGRHGPNLHVAVFAPEHCKEGEASPCLCCSSPPRFNAGRDEVFLFRIPTTRLRQAGMFVPLSPVVRQSVGLATAADVIFEDVRVQLSKEQGQNGTFVKNLRKKLERENKKAASKMPLMGSAVLMSIVDPSGKRFGSEASLTFDEKTGEPIFKANAKAKPIRLKAKKVEVRSSKDAPPRSAGIMMTVDSQKGTLVPVMTRTPLRLSENESKPSALFQFGQRRQKSIE